MYTLRSRLLGSFCTIVGGFVLLPLVVFVGAAGASLRSSRQRLEEPIPTKSSKDSPKQWLERTPAMAAELTDHIRTMDELLSFRVPPKSM
jgi:hypothetical protein